MVDRRKQRVPRTATDSKSKKAIPIGPASGSEAKQDLVSNLGAGQRSRLDRKALPEPPCVGSGAGSNAGQEWPAAEILLVDCGSDAGVHSVIALLDGLRVETVGRVADLHQHLQGLTTAGPCAVLCIMCSRHHESCGMVDVALRIVSSKPVVVIDECFEGDYGHLLLEHGALDYLAVQNLSSAELHRRIEWAILRYGYYATAPTLQANHKSAADGLRAAACQQLVDSLGARARQVLELLAIGMTPKQIAAKLGTSPKTVWNQLAGLRLRFGVNSNHALSLLVLQWDQEENEGE